MRLKIDTGGQDWPSEEKQQFSPVSVLDCLLFDDDEEIMSLFNSSTRSSLEGQSPLLTSISHSLVKNIFYYI